MNTWIDIRGYPHQVARMKISHIYNCLRMLEYGRFNDEWIAIHGEKWKLIFENELEKRRGLET